MNDDAFRCPLVTAPREGWDLQAVKIAALLFLPSPANKWPNKTDGLPFGLLCICPCRAVLVSRLGRGLILPVTIVRRPFSICDDDILGRVRIKP